MKLIVNKIWLLFASLIMHAAAPNWLVNPNAYQFSMNMTALAEIDGIECTDENDRISVWKNNELRGTAQALFVPNANRYFYFLTVYSNGGNEELTYSYYDASEDELVELKNKERFVSDKILGSLSAPYVFSNQYVLHFTSFGFVGISTQASIDTVTRKIRVQVPAGTNTAQLTALYSYAHAQSIRVNGIEQQNGFTLNNFSNPVSYAVTTIHQVNQTWTVEVSTTTGIERTKEDELSIYPIPAKEFLYMELPDPIEEVHLYDASGNLVSTLKTENRISLQGLASGIYTLRILTRQGIYMRPFIHLE
ncbi:MAG: T9SS type A sorting domain-containing protein [Cytophagaceae bacterium]|jgi:hypothetical protein|nr:T9SS type A sorting domain-containing protein [Cytophagaceae bacterium]